jgi:hypothetical protein
VPKETEDGQQRDGRESYAEGEAQGGGKKGKKGKRSKKREAPLREPVKLCAAAGRGEEVSGLFE